jgi:hypothetical protein
MTNSSQAAFENPEMSRLRKMSPKTCTSSMIQMKNMENHRIDQRTWPVPNSAASMGPLPFLTPAGVVSTAAARGRPEPACGPVAVAASTTWGDIPAGPG